MRGLSCTKGLYFVVSLEESGYSAERDVERKKERNVCTPWPSCIYKYCTPTKGYQRNESSNINRPPNTKENVKKKKEPKEKQRNHLTCPKPHSRIRQSLTRAWPMEFFLPFPITVAERQKRTEKEQQQQQLWERGIWETFGIPKNREGVVCVCVCVCMCVYACLYAATHRLVRS